VGASPPKQLALVWSRFWFASQHVIASRAVAVFALHGEVDVFLVHFVLFRMAAGANLFALKKGQTLFLLSNGGGPEVSEFTESAWFQGCFDDSPDDERKRI